VVCIYICGAAKTFAADFAGSYGSVGTNPTTNPIEYTVKNGATTIGTIDISSAGAFTFATVSNTTKAVSAGDCITIIAPSSQDATAANVGITLVAL
jgi:hypothetical protein